MATAPLRRHPALWTIVLVAVVAIALYVGLPQIAGLDATWGRLAAGDPAWLAAAALFEVASYVAYVLTFHRIFSHRCARIGWRESYDISLAGVAASRILALAGAGGIALSAWALRRSGMERRALLSGLTTFYAALYAVFMAALVLAGAGLRTGVLSGPAPLGLTVVPALFGALVIAAALAIAAVSRPVGVATGVRGAIALLRDRDVALLGAVCWWAFDLAVLAACFHAFGPAPPAGVLVMAYFTGMLANVLPFPGGLGGVEGGMIGAFLAFGVDGGLAVAVVLSYRAFAYWLPMIPGALSYVRLLRELGDRQPARDLTARP
ncbi:MAG TPA: lysylphosphatidylglycerol synthase transmembrane domain-containing protein [Solirubrobacteraceae bacterium]|nr:lysylphosphatidylglycerol synthase transmembrane domain-containing protein [Solirubrobacteraceae bacterium]